MHTSPILSLQLKNGDNLSIVNAPGKDRDNVVVLRRHGGVDEPILLNAPALSNWIANAREATASISLDNFPIQTNAATLHPEANQEVRLVATLKNASKFDYQLSHGQSLFYFVIKDPDGKQINRGDVVNQVLITRPFGPKQELTETYAYTFKQPGRYQVSVKAYFSTGKGDQARKYQVEEGPFEVGVEGTH
jgi:hypothetical protein